LSTRIYMTRSTALDEAIDAAPRAGIVEKEEAPVSRKAEGWAIYGYRRWLEEQERDEKIAAYEAIGANDDHLEAIRAANRRAVDAGIL
jgi:hypothetical protein